MKAMISRTSDSWDIEPQYKEFHTLEELIEFMEKTDTYLAISRKNLYEGTQKHDFCIEICDSCFI